MHHVMADAEGGQERSSPGDLPLLFLLFLLFLLLFLSKHPRSESFCHSQLDL